jgi:hypothetical protein
LAAPAQKAEFYRNRDKFTFQLRQQIMADVIEVLPFFVNVAKTDL